MKAPSSIRTLAGRAPLIGRHIDHVLDLVFKEGKVAMEVIHDGCAPRGKAFLRPCLRVWVKPDGVTVIKTTFVR